MKNRIIAELQKRLKPGRFSHTLGVCETAVKLAKIHGVDLEKAELAALLHDIAKHEPDDKMLQAAKEMHFPLEEAYLETPNLLHGVMSAKIAKDEFGIDDEDILNSLIYHTAGRENMSLLEKIIYLADIAEPGRKIFSGIEEIRHAMSNNINRAMILALRSSMTYVMQQEKLLIKDTVKAYNSLIAEELQKGT
ncbi:MAG: bis(5'-nucleosyl)-tetraphosphatase (symmetrical) YqeK [Christensenellaceae bacterium]|nr:bis(5'-nucleosyl)-tetraphosphatase (symmetrical) YqeK [Christensenellaceae bacterium]